MASVRQDDRHLLTSDLTSGRRSTAALVGALVIVLAAIVFFSRRANHATPAAPVETAQATEPAAAPPGPESAAPAIAPPAPTPEAAPAASVRPVEPSAADIRNQQEVARVISDGQPALAACYQRALQRDATLTNARMNVRLAIGPSGRVDTVHLAGPAEYRVLRPCVERVISMWRFPNSREPYTAEFPLALRGKQ